MHWRARRWVKVTKRELVDDGGDATHASADDGYLPGPVCQVQIKGLKTKWWCIVSRSRVLDCPPRSPVEQYSEQQQTIYDSHVSDPPHLKKRTFSCRRI